MILSSIIFHAFSASFFAAAEAFQGAAVYPAAKRDRSSGAVSG
jgi:hypothetical protein